MDHDLDSEARALIVMDALTALQQLVESQRHDAEVGGRYLSALMRVVFAETRKAMPAPVSLGVKQPGCND